LTVISTATQPAAWNTSGVHPERRPEST